MELCRQVPCHPPSLAPSLTFSLLRQLSNFAALVHVSTAFVHACNHDISTPSKLVSGFVPLSFDVTELLQTLRAKTRDEVERETPDLLLRLGGWPNTYVFSPFFFINSPGFYPFMQLHVDQSHCGKFAGSGGQRSASLHFAADDRGTRHEAAACWLGRFADRPGRISTRSCSRHIARDAG